MRAKDTNVPEASGLRVPVEGRNSVKRTVPGQGEAVPANHAEATASAELEELRKSIDGIDERIVDLLAQRHRKVQEVVGLKRAQRLPVYHPAREENLISHRRQQAEEAGLDPDHVEELYRSILRQDRKSVV